MGNDPNGWIQQKKRRASLGREKILGAERYQLGNKVVRRTVKIKGEFIQNGESSGNFSEGGCVPTNGKRGKKTTRSGPPSTRRDGAPMT